MAKNKRTTWNMPDQIKETMNTPAITNIQELKTEIYRLKHLDNKQEAALAGRFSSPSAVFSTVLTVFPKKVAVETGAVQGDYASLISRFLIPLTLNKTLFRHSNFLVKLLVGLVSQKASGLITENAVGNIVKQTRSMISKLFHKKVNPVQT